MCSYEYLRVPRLKVTEHTHSAENIAIVSMFRNVSRLRGDSVQKFPNDRASRARRQRELLVLVFN